MRYPCIPILLAFSVFSLFSVGFTGSGAAQEAEQPRAHEAHEEHDDEEHGHEEHGHEEEGVLRIDAATLKEFGIVIEEAVAGGVIEQSVQLPGEVVFNADRIAHVTPSVAGIVQRVDRSVGNRVEAGDVMAVLSSRELASVRSEYLAAEARLALAKDTLNRDERMLADRIGTERQVLESRQALREAQIALNTAEQNLHALGESHADIAAIGKAEDTTLNQYVLRSPLGGVVISRHMTRGEVISEQPEEAPFVVADLSSVWVNLTVYQRDLASVRPGMAVRIAFGYGIPEATGTIAFVSPALDETTRTANARVVLDNPDGLWRPGLFVTGHVTVGQEQSTAAVVVPRSALQTVDDDTVVFVETEEGFEPRPVRTGRTTPTQAEIVEGLRPGERYVARNAFALKAELNRASLEHAGHAH